MTDPTQPNEPVPSDPTRQMPTQPPPDPESVRTTTTTTAPGPPPRSGGLGGGAVAAIALGAAALALLIGFLVWGQDDDGESRANDAAPDSTQVEDTEPEDTADDGGDAEDTEALEARIDELESDLDAVSAERDDLQSQVDEIQSGFVELEDLVGMSIDDVRSLADNNGWELVEVEPDDADEDTETDVVLAQTPSPGTTMIEGSVLVVEVVSS